METTRHYTATAYIVCDGATALHEHDRLGLWLPPGGHVERDELPHRAAEREVREETGLDPTLLLAEPEVETGVVRSLPKPAHFLLEDIHAYEGGEVGHQHVDFVYFARVDSRDVTPRGDERDAEHWEWFTPAELGEADLGEEVVRIGREAIAAVEGEE
ncbi:NUDIX hydrolase [Halarchaeum grantii]|uniref:NUDIX hydrolase n=1 Tax=Halarchaeum grantii TaxID=1193105 RepID=A0A830F5F2_9EURY|nr:NUDIX domain-containing protein [Halarchaeum grantii]GGL22620.1 NUDIX hydrolase [Halarchaeum grantii]